MRCYPSPAASVAMIAAASKAAAAAGASSLPARRGLAAVVPRAAAAFAGVPVPAALRPPRRPRPPAAAPVARRLFAGGGGGGGGGGGPAAPPPDFTVLDDEDGGSGTSGAERGLPRPLPSPDRLPPSTASWMDRSANAASPGGIGGGGSGSGSGSRSISGGGGGRAAGRWSSDEIGGGGGDGGRSFTEDFRGTRVFVQGLPPHVMWKELKDHFRVAGEVVYASVSNDPRTGKSKGCGVVQFENTDMARNAIRIMRDHPLDGSTLYVREDYQEKKGGDDGGGIGGERRMRRRSRGGADGGGLASTWRCANEEEDLEGTGDAEREAILSLVGDRDAARRRGDYDASDAMRDELKRNFDVHVDDRLKLWWKSVDGGVPGAVSSAKGDGRWGKAKPWRMIPTTPENDALYDPDVVASLLERRDRARRDRDFDTADALLEEARTSPGGDLHLRIHDESRTFRVWTDEPPPRRERQYRSPEDARESAAEQCLALVSEHDPDKVEEVTVLLEKFPGREYNILKKLKQRYGAD